MRKWQVLFGFGWWNFDVVWNHYYEESGEAFHWWRVGPFELRIEPKNI